MAPRQIQERRSRKSLVVAASVWVFGGLAMSGSYSPAARAQIGRVIECTTGGCTYPQTVDLSTNQTVVGVQEIFACQSILAGPYPIGAAGDVTFTAGSTIGLRPGFSVAVGGTFLAVIDPNLAQ